MTTEEKAKAYDEAIKKAKEIKEKIVYSHLSTESCKAGSEYIDTTIPELAESKDEKIMKAILIYLDWLDGRKDCQPKGDYTIRDMIAYLEKQKELPFVKDVMLGYPGLYFYDGERMHFRGSPAMEEKQKEQKPVEVDESTKRLNDNWMKQHFDDYKEQKPAEPAGKLSREEYLYQLLIDQLITYSDYEYLTEHKPTDDKAFEEWIDDWWKHNKVNNPDSYDKGDEIQFDEQGFKNFCRGIRNMYQQKPAEWSEEDELMRTVVIQTLETFGGRGTTGMQIAWLKSLRPQHHKEIYQAAKRDLTIKFMNYLDENRPAGKMSLSNGECEDIDKAFKENDWAKIIRYIEKYQPHWKPSEEQMCALKRYSPVHHPDVHLVSLYDDLKKLM